MEFTLTDRIVIEAPPAAAWHVLTDFAGTAGRARYSRTRVLSPHPPGEGSRFHERVQVGPFWANFRLECTAWEPGRRFAWRARSFGVWGEHSWQLSDHASGTLVSDEERFWGPAPLVILGRLLFAAFRVDRIRRRALESLRERTLAYAGVSVR